MESESDGVAQGRGLLQTIRSQATGAASNAMARGATVASVDGDLVAVIDPSATQSDERLIARVKGPPVGVGDPGVIVPLDGGAWIFIPTGGEESSAGEPLVPNVTGITRLAVATSTGMATSSTATYVTQVSTQLTLPAGTWEIAMFYSPICLGHGGATFSGYIRISAPFVTAAQSVSAAGTGRVTAHATGSGVIVSDGVTPTIFTGQFRWLSGDSMRTENGTIFAVCWKQGTPASGGGGGGGGGGEGAVGSVGDTSTVDLVLTGDVLTANVIPGGISHTALDDIGTNDHAALDAHLASTANPHAVTKAQVGLGSADNTADVDKPVSTAQANAIATVQADVNAHEALTNNPHAVTKAQVGLGSVDNTADLDKPVSTAQDAALDLKADDAAVVHDTGNETIAGVKTFTDDPIIPNEAYGPAWNGVNEPPTKNAVYDKIETLGTGGGGGASNMPGEMKLWTLNTEPALWQFARGQAIGRDTPYGAALVADGMPYGAGDGSTTVNVPDLRGLVPIGRLPGDARFDALNDKGGAYTHLLLASESGLKQHTHTDLYATGNIVGNRAVGTGNTTHSVPSASHTGYNVATLPDGSWNAINAHNNIQPYITVEYIVYVGA